MVEVGVRIDVDVENEKGVPAPHWSDDEREASDCNSVLMTTNFVPEVGRKIEEVIRFAFSLSFETAKYDSVWFEIDLAPASYVNSVLILSLFNFVCWVDQRPTDLTYSQVKGGDASMKVESTGGDKICVTLWKSPQRF